MTMTMISRRFAAMAFLTTVALLPACGDLGSARVDLIAYEPDGSLVVFMATGIHILSPALDRESMTIGFDGLPVNTEQDANEYSLSADGRVAAVSFSPPMGSTAKSTITLFDMTTGARLQTFELEDAAPLGDGERITRRVFDLRLSPQADLVFARTYIDSDAETHVWAIRDTVIDVASGAMLWTSDKWVGWPTFSSDGTRLFATPGGIGTPEGNRLEALDPRTGAVLYGVDLSSGLNGLSLSADGNLAGIIDFPCTDVSDCAPSFGSWSTADLTLLEERPGRPQTYDYNVAYSSTIGAAFACSPFDALCALGLSDTSTLPLLSYRVSITQSDGTPVRELTVPSGPMLMAFAPYGHFLTMLPIEGNGHTVEMYNVDDGTLVASLSFDVKVP